MTTDFITLLTAMGKSQILTKRISQGVNGHPVIRDYDNVKRFDFKTIEVAGLEDITKVLDSVGSNAAITIGKPTEAAVMGARRLMYDDPKTGERATLSKTMHRYLLIDLDCAPCPEGLDPIADPEAAVEYVGRQHLPEELHNRDVYWQLTSGAGIKPGIRLRLCYWLDRLLSCEEMKQWVGKLDYVDGSIYTPNQLIYVAKPIFAKGLTDPVPRRSGIYRGTHRTVSPPDPLPRARAHVTAGGAHASKPNGANGFDGAGNGVRGYAVWCQRIGDHEGGEGFYEPIKKAIGAYVGANGSVNTEWLRADLERVIRAAPRDSSVHSDSYIEKKIRDLDRFIGWTQEQEGQQASAAPQASIEDIVSALDAIPNPLRDGNGNEVRHGWTAIGMAVVRASAGSEEGFAAFNSWSAKYPQKYNFERTRACWDCFRGAPPNEVGFEELATLARKFVPDWVPPSLRPAARAPANTAATRSQRLLAEVIASFNERYAVVNEAGKVWVFEWRLDPVLDREVLDRISHADFRRLYENDPLEVLSVEGSKTISETRTRADWWLTHRDRRQYLVGVTFDPTGQSRPGYMNLWRGFAVTPAPGDWGLMRDHIEQVICGGNRDYTDYVLNWLARLFQHPDQPGEVALVLRGKKGCGKGIFGRWIVKAFRQHGMQIFNSSQLVGRFNEHLRDCVVLFADEAFYAGDKQHEGTLKGLVTEPFLPIEAKYQRLVVVANMLHLILASNNDWVIPASVDERRFAVFDVPDARRGDIPYFGAIEHQMANGGLAAMLHELLNRDISGFEVRIAPRTEALAIQKTLSLSSLEQWWLAVLSRGFLWKSRFGAEYFRSWQTFYTTELLYRSYSQWCQENQPFDRKRREELGQFMAKLYQRSRPRGMYPVYELDTANAVYGPDVGAEHGVDVSALRSDWSPDTTSIVRQEHPVGYTVGTLFEARTRFTELYPIPTEWGEEP
jgi:hypothetical protein